MYSAKELIKLAMLIEERGEDFYLEAVNVANDEKIKELLKTLAEEESKHRAKFLDIKRSIDDVKKQDLLEKVSIFFMDSAFGERFFSADKKAIESIENLEKAVEFAISLEEESILFYEILKGLAMDEQALSVLEIIIEEEKSHIEVLKNILEKLRDC